MKAASVILIVLSVLLASCGNGDAWRSMDVADSLMEQSPNSALALLQTIDSTAVSGRKMRARHALLTTQAHVKTDRLTISDTAALPLLDYYNDHGPDFDRMRAAFYKAEIYSLTNNNGERIKNLLHAEDIASKIFDNYWLAKINEQLADIYHSNHYYSKSVILRHKVIEYYNKANKTRNESFAWLDLGLDLHGNRQDTEALRIIDSIIGRTSYTEDPILYLYGLDYKIFITANSENFAETEACIKLKNRYLEHKYAKSFNDLYYEILLNIKNGNSVNSTELALLKKSMSGNDDFARYYWLLAEWYRSNRQADSVYIALDSVRQYYNEITFSVLQQSIISEELNYSNELLAESKKESRIKLFIISGFSIISILCALLYFWIARARNLKKDIDIHDLQNELNHLKLFSGNVIKELQGQNNSLVERLIEEQNRSNELNTRICEIANNPDKQRYISLIRSYTVLWEHMSNICTSYFNSSDAETKGIRYKKVMRAIASLGNSENLESLVSGINRVHGNVLMIIQDECNMISQEDINMFALLYAGASMRIISLILDLNLSTLYSRKESILKAIRLSSSWDRPEIRTFFDSLK